MLTELPPKPRAKHSGRPRVRGHVLPKPQALACDTQQPWEMCEAQLYGSRRKVHYKSFCAQWYRACGDRLLRIVVTRAEEGSIGLRVFFCTDPTMSVRQVLEGYEGRWAIEVCFRDLKQLLGFADSSARKQAAVERAAPFVGFMYTLLVLWFMAGAYKQPYATPPVRPWYPHKRSLSFADVLRAAQRVLALRDILDLASSFDDLHETPPPPGFPSEDQFLKAS